MKKTLLALFALTLCVGAFAQATGIPPANPPAVAAPDPVAKELADTKAQLAQTQQAAQVEINRLSVLAERNEFAYRLTVANQENVALRNEVASARARAQELQTNLNDVQGRYDMEKAKVEALLKKHPSDSVAAQQVAKPAPAIPANVGDVAAKK